MTEVCSKLTNKYQAVAEATKIDDKVAYEMDEYNLALTEFLLAVVNKNKLNW